MSPVRIPARRAVACAATLTATLALGATSVSAAPYEQINRESGAQGVSEPGKYQYFGTAVGDVGRYAGFERLLSVRQPGDLPEGFVRDIQSNTTLDYGGGVRRVYAIDRAEKRVLLLRTRNGMRQIAVVPIAGGAPIIVTEFPAGGVLPEATLSGDGKKVVISREGFGTRVYDLTGGVVGEPLWLNFKVTERFAPRGISDDGGTVIAASSLGSGQSVYRTNSGEVELPDSASAAAVDATGTTVAWIEPGNNPVLVTRSLTTGVERRVPAIYPSSVGAVLWVGQGGSRVVVAPPNYDGPFSGALAYTPGPGLDGTWAKYGGRFASSILSGWDGFPTVLSPSGRFGVNRGAPGLGTVISLFDTTGTHIVGANEPFDPSAFIRANQVPIGDCPQPVRLTASLSQPTPFATMPTKAVITAKRNGVVFASGTLTKAQAFGYLGTPAADEKVTGLFSRQGASTIELTATITDGEGRVVTGTTTSTYPSCT